MDGSKVYEIVVYDDSNEKRGERISLSLKYNKQTNLWLAIPLSDGCNLIKNDDCNQIEIE